MPIPALCGFAWTSTSPDPSPGAEPSKVPGCHPCFMRSRRPTLCSGNGGVPITVNDGVRDSSRGPGELLRELCTPGLSNCEPGCIARRRADRST